MQNSKCRHCGSPNVRVKDIEVRHINTNTMALRSRETIREMECQSCGLVLSLPGRQVAHV